MRRVADTHGVADVMNYFDREAFEMVTGERARKASDIAEENPRLRELYGRNSTGQSLLLVRRLVEAGVTFVTVRVSG